MKTPSSLKDWLSCQRCGLGKIANHHVVGRGVLPCKVLFLGESPGRSEDAIGEAFVGRAGRLLDKAIGETTVPLFFTNLTMCRGTDEVGGENRTPTPEEIFECLPRLVETFRLAAPKGVVCCGMVPASAYRQWVAPALEQGRATGRPPFEFNVPHPAYILRTGGEKSEGWDRYCATIRGIIRRCA